MVKWKTEIFKKEQRKWGRAKARSLHIRPKNMGEPECTDTERWGVIVLIQSTTKEWKNHGNNWLNIQKLGPGNKPRWKQGCPKSEWSCTDELEKEQKSPLRAVPTRYNQHSLHPEDWACPQRDRDPLNPSLMVYRYTASKVKGPVDTHMSSLPTLQ